MSTMPDNISETTCEAVSTPHPFHAPEKTGGKYTAQYVEQLRILHEIDIQVLEARSVESVAQVILQNSVRLMPWCQWASVALFNPESDDACILAVRSNSIEAYKEKEHLPMGNFRVAASSRKYSIHWVENLHVASELTPMEMLLAQKGIRSFLSVPLVTRGRLIGALNLGGIQARAYSQECVDIARKIGRSLAAGVGNVRLMEAEQRRNKELLAVTLVSAALRMAQTRAEIPPIILDQLLDLLQATSALLAWRESSTATITVELALGGWEKATGEHLAEGESILWKVLEMGRPYVSDEGKDDPLLTPYDLAVIGNTPAFAFIPLIVQKRYLGVLGIGRRGTITQEEKRLLVSVADMAASAMHRAVLAEELRHSHRELERAYDSTLEGWARALELRDRETEGHARRVTEMTVRLARAMGIEGEMLAHLRRGALLHDIGKMGIPDNILLKPGPLTEEEWSIMRQHPQYARDMLSPITFLHPALDIPYCHHEKWDGTGYPRELKGEEIPLAARIFAVVDVWDALTGSDRPYREAWSREKAMEYIRSQAGKHFDPRVVEVFLATVG